jgi:hypothetical protein
MDFQLSSYGLPASSFQLPGEIGSIPVFFVIAVITCILYYALVFKTGYSGEGGDTSGLQMVIWLVFVFLIVINGAIYILNTDLFVEAKDLLTDPKVDVVQFRNDDSPPKVSMLHHKEVYNIPGQFTYDNAKAVCAGAGGKLATYQEIEDAYEKGSEWSQYGWSDGQLGLFPTQQKSYDKLQTIDGHENDRGRPGVNGGFIDNPDVRYGANCFGSKPGITSLSASAMASQTLYPKTKEELIFDKKVAHYKSKLPSMVVSPFNPTQYSQ